MKVAVVGVGAMGAQVLRQLSRRGVVVTGFETYALSGFSGHGFKMCPIGEIGANLVLNEPSPQDLSFLRNAQPETQPLNETALP